MEDKTEKKSTRKKPLDEKKVKEARQKVNELLAGTGLEDKFQEEAEVFTPPTQAEDEFLSGSDQATAWLNQQVETLSQQVESQQKIINQLKADNQNLINTLNSGGGGGISGSISEAKIIDLFREFENVYTGRKLGQPYDTIKFSNPQFGNGVLDVLLRAFPFLHGVRQYHHRP